MDRSSYAAIESIPADSIALFFNETDGTMRLGLSTLLILSALLSPRFSLALDDADRSPQAAIELFAEDERSLNHYYDHPSDKIDRARHRDFFESRLSRLRKIDFDSLDLAAKIDFILFENHLRHELKRLELEAERDKEIEDLVPFRETILSQDRAARRGETIDPAKAAATLAEMTKSIDRLRERIESNPSGKDHRGGSALSFKRTVAYRAARQIDELRELSRRRFEFYDGYDPLFSWWNKAPGQDFDRSLKRLAIAIRERLAHIPEGDRDAIVGDPIGREALIAELGHEMIDATPEELIRLAEDQFAFCETELKKAAAELGFGEDWRKAIEAVKEKHVPPGKQPDLIRELADEAVRFIKDRDLVTIPPLCLETWRMEMMSPDRQRINPFFTGGETISVSYPTDSMSHAEKLMSMRGNNIHFSRATVHHELIPGHHLQGFQARRERPYRRLFRTPFLVEGWSLYWEMLLWDLGFPQTAEDRVGMLFWRSHRCARIIFSLKFHLEKMSAEEAIDFLVDRVGHERANATAEVRRSFAGGYSPLYQAAYMIGGLQLRALHHELVDGGRMTEREFHDAVLKENAVPIELIRASLTRRPPRRDFKPSWNFRADVPAGRAYPKPKPKSIDEK